MIKARFLWMVRGVAIRIQEGEKLIFLFLRKFEKYEEF